MFLAMEGIDCCGKTTHTKLLAQKLDARRFKFPDVETSIGKVIYGHLFRKWGTSKYAGDETDAHIDAIVFQALQLANRLEHAEETANVLHMSNQDVVADRYIASGVVYGASDGLDGEYIYKIQQYLPQPDINILLDIDVEVAKERMRLRGDTPDRYENEKTLKDIIDRYQIFWSKMRRCEGDDRWIIINANKSKTKVQADVIEAVKTFYTRS